MMHLNYILEAKNYDFGAVIWPLTNSKVKVTINFFSCKQFYMMDLKKRQVHVLPSFHP